MPAYIHSQQSTPGAKARYQLPANTFSNVGLWLAQHAQNVKAGKAADHQAPLKRQMHGTPISQGCLPSDL